MSGFLGGRLTLEQPAGGHRVGTDAALLAAFAPVEPGDRVADLGAGVGAVGLAIAVREPSARVSLVEIEPNLQTLAAANIAANGLSDRVGVLPADILAPARARQAAGLAAGGFDLVATNPPYGEEGRGRGSPDATRRLAHALPAGGLSRWLATAADMLGARGRLLMIHRADAIAAVLEALKGRFGGVEIKPVHPRAGEAATRILVRARKASRAAPALRPPLVLHEPGGAFTTEADALHRGKGHAIW